MKKIKKENKKILIYIVGVLLIVSGLLANIIHKINLLSRDPEEDFDCERKTEDDENTNTPNTEVGSGVYATNLNWLQRGGFVNDASCLNKTSVYGVVKIQTEEDIKNALSFAREKDLKVAMAGVKHSMGGQAFAKQALILDMKGFNQIELDRGAETITVQSGATWHDIQNKIHPDFAVIAMQSTDIFTVGGSISVNAHGMDHKAGSVAKTIENMRIMLADGEVLEVSPTKNMDLFRHIVGGYGLFGVILDVKLRVTPNVVYDYKHEVIKTGEFPEYFQTRVESDPNLNLFYGHLSTAPSNLLNEMLIYRYEGSNIENLGIPPLYESTNVRLTRFILNLSKYSRLAKQFKWFAEKNIEPMLTTCPVSRPQAMKDGEACLVSRNQPMHDSVKYLNNDLKNDTDILQEYYIPRDKFLSFVDQMRVIFLENKTNLINASVRVVHKEDIALNYAPEDMFAVVLYVNQTTDEAGKEKMKGLTSKMINLTTDMGGTFFLPYQLSYSAEQLGESYPNYKEFFKKKIEYDPNELFTSTFYETYKI